MRCQKRGPSAGTLGPAGAAAAYRRTAWEQVGGMDERIFAYMEDFDLALRLRAAGWRTVAAPDARGVHLGSASHGHRSASQRSHGGFGRGYRAAPLRRASQPCGRPCPDHRGDRRARRPCDLTRPRRPARPARRLARRRCGGATAASAGRGDRRGDRLSRVARVASRRLRAPRRLIGSDQARAARCSIAASTACANSRAGAGKRYWSSPCGR